MEKSVKPGQRRSSPVLRPGEMRDGTPVQVPILLSVANVDAHISTVSALPTGNNVSSARAGDIS